MKGSAYYTILKGRGYMHMSENNLFL